MAKVSIRNVSKLFRTPAGREINALKDVSIEIPNGEFLVLAGPSGCGKSTLLRTIAGLEQPTSGDVFIGEKRVNDLPPKDRDVAMVFQSHALFPHLNVRDNIAFGLKLRGRPQHEIKTRVGEAASILEIESLLDRKPSELSGGQRQRVALGRAIVRQPRVFLLDEPLSQLDAPTRARNRAELSKLHARLQTTMIYVTHDQVEAMSLGTRLAIMEGGTIRQAAPPAALYQEPDDLFVAGFLGNPAMNLVRGKLSASGDRLVFKEDDGVIECRLPESERPALKPFVGQDVVLGLRPEDIERKEGGLPAKARDRVENTFQCLVDLIEPVGGETNLYLQTGKGTVICRVHAMVDGRETGHRAQFQVNVARAHFFDPVTTRRIG